MAREGGYDPAPSAQGRTARRSARCMRGDPADGGRGDRADGTCGVTGWRSARRGEARRGRDTWRERCALWKENIYDKEMKLCLHLTAISLERPGRFCSTLACCQNHTPAHNAPLKSGPRAFARSLPALYLRNYSTDQTQIWHAAKHRTSVYNAPGKTGVLLHVRTTLLYLQNHWADRT